MTKKKTNLKRVVKWYSPSGTTSMLTDLASGSSYYKKETTTFFKYAYILHKISKHFMDNYLAHKMTRLLAFETYTGCPIRIETLSDILGCNNATAVSMVDDLISIGLIKKVSGYITGVQSTRYSLTYEPEEFDVMEVSEADSKIPFKIIDKRNSKSIKTEDVEEYAKLLKGLNISSDVYSLVSIINPTSFSISTTPPMMGISDSLLDGKKVTDIIKLSKAEVNGLAVRAIEDGEWFCHRPTEGSRVHTNLTNLNRNFRPFLNYEGKDLVELDIRNSQPLIASLLIKNWFVQQNLDIPADVIEYKKNCESGTFYDYFMEMNGVTEENRSEFKVQFFAEIFFSKVSKRNTKLKTQFIEKYPNCYKAICDIKGGYGSKTYNQFAILLQKKEAQLIFDTINMGLIKEGIPAFNIFDSILVPTEYKDVAEELILTTFSKENLKPTINYTELKTKRDNLLNKEKMSIIAINTNGVVFQSVKNEKVLATLTLDSQHQIRAILEADDFSALNIESVDYNYLKKYNNNIEQKVVTATPIVTVTEEAVEPVKEAVEVKDNSKEEVSKKLTTSGKVIVGKFLASKVAKELLQTIYKEIGIKENPTGTTIKEYYSVKEHTARVDGKLTKGFMVLGKKAVK